jgi:hypothetical protein
VSAFLVRLGKAVGVQSRPIDHHDTVLGGEE